MGLDSESRIVMTLDAGGTNLRFSAFNLEDPVHLDIFLKGETRTIKVPGSERTLAYDPLQPVGVGVTRLGTSEAVAIGAYVSALKQRGA